jgi:hypothetical protein
MSTLLKICSKTEGIILKYRVRHSHPRGIMVGKVGVEAVEALRVSWTFSSSFARGGAPTKEGRAFHSGSAE